MTNTLKMAILGAAGMAVAAAGLAVPVQAADYPNKVIEAVVPFGAGGGTDRWARVMSSVAFDVFDDGMRIQNRGGASGTVGWKYMLDQGADGHTLLFASPTPVIAALLEENPPFDPGKDAKIVAYYSIMKPTLMARKDGPYSTWEKFVEAIKSEDKKPTIGGTITQTLGPASILKQMGLENEVILVNYSGTGKAVNDFLGGHIDLAAVTTSTAITLTDDNVAILNATDLDYPKDIADQLGDVPNAAAIGMEPYNPPRFFAMHPETTEEQAKVMSEKLGNMLETESVQTLIKKLGEEIVYVPYEKAQPAYDTLIKSARENLSLFK